MCGPRLCSFTGSRHLAWSVPLLPPTYFLPPSFIHFFLFFIPALLVPGEDWRARLVTFVFVLVTGPLVAMPLARGKAYNGEWPAMWCLFSVGQALSLLAAEVWKGALSGGGGGARQPTRVARRKKRASETTKRA